MARFYQGEACVQQTYAILALAEHRIVLIDPDLGLSDELKLLLDVKLKDGVIVHMAYSARSLRTPDRDWLISRPLVRLHTLKDLSPLILSDAGVAAVSGPYWKLENDRQSVSGVMLSSYHDASAYKEAADYADMVIDTAKKMSWGKASIATGKLGKLYGLDKAGTIARLVMKGLLRPAGDIYELTEAGIELGGEFVAKSPHGPYFTWKPDTDLSIVESVS